jgi:hypothetical protein
VIYGNKELISIEIMDIIGETKKLSAVMVSLELIHFLKLKLEPCVIF